MCSAFSLEVIMAENKSSSKTAKKTTEKKTTAKKKLTVPQVEFDGVKWDVINRNHSGDILIKSEKGVFIIKASDVKPLNKEAEDYING